MACKGTGTYWDEVVDVLGGLMKNKPPGLWAVLLIVVFQFISHFMTAYIMVLYLSSDFGYSDQDAGWVYGLLGLNISVFSIAFGWVVDLWGVRRTMIAANLLLVVSRLIFGLTTSDAWMLFSLLVLRPFAGSLNFPSTVTAIRRYSTGADRADVFGLYVVASNLGQLIAALLVDGIRLNYMQDTGGLNQFRIIILITAGFSLLASIIAYFYVRDVDMVTRNGKVVEVQTRSPLVPEQSVTSFVRGVLGTVRFWRFMALITVLTGVRLIYRHLDATFPKAVTRRFGDEVPYALITAISPAATIFMVPLFTPLARHFDVYTLLIVGASITTGSVLWMLIDDDEIYPSCLFVLTLALGDAIWHPRLFEYVTMIAPKGREGTYSGLANAPMFIARFASGGISGYLLTEFCPAEANPENFKCQWRELWWFVFVCSCWSAPLMAMLRHLLYNPEDLEDDDTEESDRGALLTPKGSTSHRSN